MPWYLTRLPRGRGTNAKRQAAEAGITLTAIIEESLRERLARRTTRVREPVRLHVAGKGGVRPGVDLDDSASLFDLRNLSTTYYISPNEYTMVRLTG